MSKELKTKEDFRRYRKEKHEGFLMLKNYLEEMKQVKRPPKSYLSGFLKERKGIKSHKTIN